MIPNIFISSTISDLNYLRDALRDAILDLAYNPVMSDRGEVGYLHPETAASSCYRSLSQCQMVVLVIGKRYGMVKDKGVSVTQHEFETAQENNIPTIGFIEPQVLNYKEVYDADPSATLWNAFPGMDEPRKTFAFIDKIKAATTYNSLIPFTNASDAKRILKLQIADFVGERLNGTIKPVRADVHEILAEIKTLRNDLSQSKPPTKKQSDKSKRFLTTMRFLLEDKTADYKQFVEQIAGTLEIAVPKIIESKQLIDYISKFGHIIEFEDSREIFDKKVRGSTEKELSRDFQFFMINLSGWYVIDKKKTITINNPMFDKLDALHKSLQFRLGNQQPRSTSPTRSP